VRWKHDEWAQRWNAERLVDGVEEVLRRWDLDPTGTAGRLDGLLRTATPRAVLFLEKVYRGRHRSLSRMLAGDAGALTGNYGRYATAVAALLTLDRSGHLREAGVRYLAGGDELFTLPYLLLRLGDPVDPVREQATSTVYARLTAGRAALLVPLLPLVEVLGARRRAAPTVRALGALLIDDPEGRAALWAGARGDDAEVAASCRRMLAATGPAGAVEHAVAPGDPAPPVRRRRPAR
jgi:hypothetical protein